MAQTVIITETSAYVVLTFSGTKVKYVPKQAFAIQYDPTASDEDKVILSWGSGVTQSKYDFERLNYLKVTSPSLASDAALVALLTAMADNAVGASSGGAGGGSIVYTNAANDFQAAVTVAAKTITLTELPFVLESKHVVGGTIVKVDSAGNPTTIFNGSQQFTVSGDVITLPDADDFVSGDTVVVTLIADDKAYAKLQDALKVLIQNSEWAHYTTVQPLIGVTNDAELTVQYKYFTADGFRNWLFEINGLDAGTLAMKLYATLDPDETAPATGVAVAAASSWLDITDDVFGTSGGISSATRIKYLKPINTPYMPFAFLVEFDFGSSTNDLAVKLRKY